MNNKDKKRVDQDIRPKLWFSNYDYAGPEEATEISPGKGLYNGKMDRYKNVKDFIEQKRKRRRELKNAKFTSDQLLKAATRFSQLVAQVSSNTMDLTEMMSDIVERFDPDALAAVQGLSNSGQLSAGTNIDLSVDVSYNPIKKGNSYVAQAVVKVTGNPDNVKNVVQKVANKYQSAISNKLTTILANGWLQEEEEKKREPSAPGPRGGSFNLRKLNFSL